MGIVYDDSILRNIQKAEHLEMQKSAALAAKRKEYNSTLWGIFGAGVILLTGILLSIYLNNRAILFIFSAAFVFVINELVSRSSVLNPSLLNKKVKAPAVERHDKLFKIAAFILSSNERTAALGDMDEKYAENLERFGAETANQLLARDVADTFIERTFPAVESLVKWAIGIGILKYAWQMISQFPFVQKIIEFLLHR